MKNRLLLITLLLFPGLFYGCLSPAFSEESFITQVRQALADELTEQEREGLSISREIESRVTESGQPVTLLLLTNNETIFFACFKNNSHLVSIEKVGFRYPARMEVDDVTGDHINEIILYHGYHPGTGMFTEFVTVYKWKDGIFVKIWEEVVSEKNGPYTVGDTACHTSNSIQFLSHGDSMAKEIKVHFMVYKVKYMKPAVYETIETIDTGFQVFYWDETLYEYRIKDTADE